MRRLLASLLLVGAVTLGAGGSAAAYNPFGQVNCSGPAKDSAVCKDQTNQDPLTGSDGLIIKAARIIATIGGVVAVIIVVIGGIRYITSNGDSAQISSAKHTIIYALIGLVFMALAPFIVSFVVNLIYK